ncbi:hypothetical protein OAP63_17025 [Vibrio sp.]|nr:hypothetical protein [Vibrio sp.]
MQETKSVEKSTQWMTRVVIALFILVLLVGGLAVFGDSSSSSENYNNSNSYSEENPFN